MGAVGQRNLTHEQRRAIVERGVSVALSAGAGCGKTFVLTERFLAQLDPAEAAEAPALSAPDAAEPSSLGELVAITFTERAAREMRDRIRAACRERLLAAPGARVDYWLRLIRQIDSARISTIHSFCGSLLRSHAVEAGLDPHFRVLEQAQADTLTYELVDDELRSRLVAADRAVVDLVVDFGLETLRGMLFTLLGRRQEIDWAAWRSVAPAELVARWERFLRETVVRALVETVAQSPPAQTVLRIAREHVPSHPKMRERCGELLTRIPRLAASPDPRHDLEVILDNARVQNGGGKKAWPSEEVYNEFRDAAGKLRETIKKATADLEFDADAALPAADAGLRLLSVAGEIAEAYEARKRELAALDFNDLLIHARRLLTAPENEGLRQRLAAQIRLLLVDEFQDTDPLQVELVKALCDPMLTRGKLFFVGDYKQSIYRFRGADPHVFRRLRADVPPEGRLPLTLNFRSQPAILHFVNALFCDALGPEYEPLMAHRPQVGAEPAIELLWAPDEEAEGGPEGDRHIFRPDHASHGAPGRKMSQSPARDNESGNRSGKMERLRRREAEWIARRVRAMLEGGERIVWDKAAAERGAPATRAVQPGDVALLFRALSDVQYYEEALQRYDIPYYLVGGHAFYAQQEIYDLVSLLRSLASPCDQVSLAGVLRSPMFALEDETLFWLAQQPGGLSGGLFADAPPAELGPAQRRRVEFAKSVLAELRAIKDRVPIAELVQTALSRTGYDAVLLAEFLGERKLANLQKLVDQARSFDRSGIFSLADFITQLSEFVTRQLDEPLAATHPESSDVVRLMSVHQSKGLEFPVVIVPDLDRAMRGPANSVAFTPDMGPMVRTSGPDGFRLHAAMERVEEQNELVRLLYVATTRAADYLVLSGGVSEIGSTRGPWTQLVAERFDPATGRLRASLPEGFAEPKLKVTAAEPPLAGKAAAKKRRRSLARMADRARRMAKQGGGRFPSYLEPVPVDRAARRQYSFSRLTGELHAHAPVPEATGGEEGDSAARPARLDPLGLGTLVHDVLAEIDFARPDQVEPLVRRFAPRHLPDVEELDEPIDLVRRFLESPRAAAIAGSERVYRELEFLLAWPPGTEEPGPRYLQGFIDCLYQDSAGRWVVADYKTNQATASTIAAIAAGYEMQMLLYALAVERILGEPPADLVLCFLRPGTEHHFAWNAAARGRVVELVDRALAASAGLEVGSRE